MASDINHTQTPPLPYVSSARAIHAFVHDIVRCMAAAIIVHSTNPTVFDIAISCDRYDHYS